MTMYPPECFRCKHFHRPSPGEQIDGLSDEAEVVPDRTCDAFPEGIPREIYYGVREGDEDDPVYRRVLHHTAHPGDHGIQFAPLSDETGSAAA